MKVARPLAIFCIAIILMAGALPVYGAGEPLEKYRISYGGASGIPLERYLWQSGAYPVNYVSIGGKNIDWADAAVVDKAISEYRMVPG